MEMLSKIINRKNKLKIKCIDKRNGESFGVSHYIEKEKKEDKVTVAESLRV
ncbi:MAG: hypothetical protein ACRC28_09905 [Clostridium sp.]|uniref:hypothetical protein n=1 Tax=Clostridium sp. TaxID=1506 RepID=UPI003F3FE05A